MPDSRPIRPAALLAAALLFAAPGAPPVLAQQPASTASGVRTLSLDDALRIAEGASEDIAIARAGVSRAQGERLRARSGMLPQLAGSFTYTRTLASQFEGVSFGGGAPRTGGAACNVPPTPATTTDQRLDSLITSLHCPVAAGGGIDFRQLGFGAENAYTFGLAGSQTLFAGGRIVAQNRAAAAGARAAEVGLTSAKAQLLLDVTQAYFDAALADRLVGITQASLEQAEATLRQTTLARQVGNQPEFDLLRAQVTRDNLRPQVIQALSARDLAYLRLKQLLEIPLDQGVSLTSALGDSTAAPPARLASLEAQAPDTAVDRRAPVRQAREAVSAQENALKIVESQRLPQVSLSSQYGRVGYTAGGLPAWDNFRNNWTVSLGVQVPLFTGGRIKGDELVARANLDEQRLRLQQVRELAQLDARNAVAQLEAADAQWRASSGTASQAARAYSIAEIRYREGISTQTELSESRLLLSQAQAYRAQAARDLQVARARVALLRDLPIGTAGASRGQSAQGGQGGAGQGGAPGAGQGQQSGGAGQQGRQGQQGGSVLTSQTGTGVP